MSTERKMIGLSVQAHFVPQVRIDYGTWGTPSLVVKTTKGTNPSKYEYGRKKARNPNNHLAQKAEYRIRSKRSGLDLDSFNHTQNEFHSPIPGSQASISGQRHFQFLAIGSNSHAKHARRSRSSEPVSMRDRSTVVHSGNRRWVHPPPSFPKPGACLFSRRSNPISKININKQAESHPTGILAGEPEVKYSLYHQSKPRAHLLHRIIERYHE